METVWQESDMSKAVEFRIGVPVECSNMAATGEYFPVLANGEEVGGLYQCAVGDAHPFWRWFLTDGVTRLSAPYLTAREALSDLCAEYAKEGAKCLT